MLMESPERIESRLQLTTEADSVTHHAISGERLEYQLTFIEDVGFMWLNKTLTQLFAELSTPMQKWEIEPADDGFVVTVRETKRRANLNTEQGGLDEWS